MNLKFCLFLLISALCNGHLIFAQLVKVEDFAPKRADTIILERNWRTHRNIILSELEFAAGDTVNTENLALSLKKIWNLQNFVSVDYRWDSLPDGRSALVLTARDAITIRPVIAGHTDVNQDFTVKLGVADRNFLGRNIVLEMRAQASVHDPVLGEVNFTIPRQLLWKNMSIGGGFEVSEVFQERFKRMYIHVVNPFHQDFRNTVAPDIEAGWLKNYSIPPSFPDHDSVPEWYRPYEYNFCYLRIFESMGLIIHRRHQEEGYLITGMIGADMGLDAKSENYIEASLHAEYNRILRPKLQFGARWDVNYSSSGNSSFWTRLGPSDIPGIDYGDISGPLMHQASVGLYYTWLDKDYLAIEQSVFVQYASAMEIAGDWSSAKNHYAIGTGFQFIIPMFPAASFRISFCYNPNRFNWFYLEL